MDKALRLLVVEDNEADFRLVERHLARHGLRARCHRVATMEELTGALAQEPWDAVLSDFNLPQMDFHAILALLRERHPDLPTLLVSGSVGEERAVELLKLGAWDFVLKDNLARLVPAIEQSLREVSGRRARRKAEAALRESEEQFHILADGLDSVVWLCDPQVTRIYYVNASYERIWGRTCESLYAEPRSFLDAVHPDDRARVESCLGNHAAEQWEIEFRIVRPDGALRWIRDRGTPVLDEQGRLIRMAGLATDITEAKRVEESLRESEVRHRLLFESARDGMALADAETGRLVDCNRTLCEMVGRERAELVGQHQSVLHPPEENAGRFSRSFDSHRNGRADRPVEDQLVARGGRTVPVEINASCFRMDGRDYVLGVFRDITERQRAERERDLMIRILNLFNRPGDLHALLRDAALAVREALGFEAVGIRLREGDDFPYFETAGLSEEFVRTENSLCLRNGCGQPLRDSNGAPLLACMCGNILSGRFDPAKPFFTPRGSFWTNSTTDLLAATSDADRMAQTRNRCHGEGFESVGLFALRAGGVIQGLLQVTDHRRGRFSPERLRLLERIADNLAVSVSHRIGQQRLEELAQQRQLALDAAQLGWWHYDLATKLSRWDARYAEIFGVEGAGGDNEQVLKLIHPDDLPRVWAAVERALDPVRGTSYAAEYRLNRADGTIRWVEAHGQAIFEGEGVARKAVALVGTVEDITERRRAEAALRESEERYRLLADHTDDFVLIRHVDDCWAYVSPSFYRVTGWTPADFQSSPLRERIHPDDRPEAERAHAANLAGETTEIEFRLRCRDGSWMWTNTRCKPLTGPDGRVDRLLLWARDCTQRKQVVDLLRESEHKFRVLFESSHDAILILGPPDWTTRDANPAAHDMFRLPAGASFAGLGAWDLSPDAQPDGRPSAAAARAKIEEALLEGSCSFEWTHRRCDGEAFPAAVLLSAFDLNGERLVQATVRDVTAQKRAAESQARLVTAVEQAGEAIVITDPQGSIQYVNPAFVRTTGYTREEALGQNPRVLKSGLHDEAFYRDMWSALRRGEVWQGHFVNRRKDGRAFDEDATISPVRDAAGRIVNFVAVKRDVTDRMRLEAEKVQLEAQLRQAQKLEAVGRLAGGVAHDYNNMLMVILGHCEIALEKAAAGRGVQDDLREILAAGRRSQEVTRQLLAFARRQAIAPRVIDLNESIQGMFSMLRRLVGEEVALAWRAQDGLWPVLVDPSQLDQVLANLCVNARDAIAGAGRILLATQNATLDADWLARHGGGAPGEYVMLSVTDDGCGMAPDLLERIFEPFFTTKGPDKGTGLGLATVYGIVRQNRGAIDVESAPGKGSTFRIYLPRAEGAPVPAPGLPPPEPPRGRGEKVLVVEDDGAILRLVGSVLQGLGYEPLLARTPGEALLLAADPGQAFDLLLTDVILPEVNGRALAVKLRGLRPGLRCLYMSGYTADVIAQRGVIEPEVSLLSKPFTSAQLAERVRAALDAPAA